METKNNTLENDISMIEEERSETSVNSLSVSSANSALLTQAGYSGVQNIQETSLPTLNAAEVLGVPSDPWVTEGGAEQWQHLGEYGLNTVPVWNDYTGAGVLVAVIDDGFNYNHSELSANYRTDIDLDVLNGDNDALNTSNNTHGTFVSQVIAGDDNGSHGVGVA